MSIMDTMDMELYTLGNFIYKISPNITDETIKNIGSDASGRKWLWYLCFFTSRTQFKEILATLCGFGKCH